MLHQRCARRPFIALVLVFMFCGGVTSMAACNVEERQLREDSARAVESIRVNTGIEAVVKPVGRSGDTWSIHVRVPASIDPAARAQTADKITALVRSSFRSPVSVGNIDFGDTK